MLNRKWSDYFSNMAQNASGASKDASTKVGAVLVRPDKSIASTGFNGFPARLHDNELYLNATTPEMKAFKYQRMIHAEANCLDHCRDHDLTGYAMFVTHHPCDKCALRITNTGISEVYYRKSDLSSHWNESLEIARTLLAEADIRLYGLD